tara:strand:- start:20929 stop:21765 length:837 start_codon:yes stop_codon:yes gene_type:complete
MLAIVSMEMNSFENSQDLSPASSKDKLCLSTQVAHDLKEYLSQFSNPSFGIRVLSKETGLNPKTIKRLMEAQNKATYQTLFLLYSEFYETKDLCELLDKAPMVVADKIKDFTPCESTCDEDKLDKLIDSMKKEPIMAELFVLAGTGPLLTSVVGFRYGQYGIQILEKLVQEELLIKVNNETYILSKKTPTLTGKALKFLGEYFTHRFSKAEESYTEGENTISFYAESLNEEGKKAWLSVDTESFYKKLEIANNKKYQGNIPMFTFTSTDTIKIGNQNV